jgi:YidC/Oxa1 family membrane protein insertase
MDKNTFTGLFLIMIVLAGSFYFFKPSEAEMKKERERISLDSAMKAGVKPAPADLPAAAPVVDSSALKGPFGANISGKAITSVLENSALKLTFTNKGGKIKSVEIKGEKSYVGKPVVLFDGDENKFGLSLNIGGKIISTNDLYFTATQTSNSMVMRANYSADKYHKRCRCT